MTSSCNQFGTAAAKGWFYAERITRKTPHFLKTKPVHSMTWKHRAGRSSMDCGCQDGHPRTLLAALHPLVADTADNDETVRPRQWLPKRPPRPTRASM